MKMNASSQPPDRIRAVDKALPKHYSGQETPISVFRDAWAGAHDNPERPGEFRRFVQGAGRYLALPLEAYRDLKWFAARNESWTRAAVDLGKVAIREALKKAGLLPTDVDHPVFVPTTGLATPSIDACPVNRLGLHRDIRRTPIFGLGCLGGAAGSPATRPEAAGAAQGRAEGTAGGDREERSAKDE
jgi:alkylresorcinol/alkylpyrone synthase